MFIDITMTGIESDHRRQALLADAGAHRLATVARAGRRAARRVAEQLAARNAEHVQYAPPGIEERVDRPTERATTAAGGKVGANRR